MKLSVIICTHNPHRDYLFRTLAALQQQTLGRDQWEFLLIDNASRDSIAETWDLTWHPKGRHVREEELGVTPARLRGIRESVGELIVFVDDDNIIDCFYLENALRIHCKCPFLGAYGAGKIAGEFESPPLPETIPFLPMVALRDEPRPLWSNQQSANSSIPYGAGQCVLRQVALEYVKALQNDQLRKALGRYGNGYLLSCEDIDLALFACTLGYGTGVFPELSMTHLIPPRRLEPKYLEALAEGHAASFIILAHLWGSPEAAEKSRSIDRLRHLRRLLSLKGLARKIYLAERRGRKKAFAQLASLNLQAVSNH
ncbi:MAG: glycosyltransferase [Verrucomicrobiota bacterium]